MSAPRDLVADARTKAVAMRANFQPGVARLLTELADQIERLRAQRAEIRTLAADWAEQPPDTGLRVQQIEDGCALLLLIDGRTLPEESPA